ncbi:hypothetical protein XH88_18660 [Bradyrhizobium sp. CCBAU 51627]|nr:hypothetical protein [Bradyrhizobium sp. CCBAU 51627]
MECQNVGWVFAIIHLADEKQNSRFPTVRRSQISSVRCWMHPRADGLGAKYSSQLTELAEC